MADSRYDFVIFGASGFTGQFVVEEMVRIVQEEKGSLTFAVAGRNMQKLQSVLERASLKTGEDLEAVPIIIADANSETSLNEMCQQAKVVLNCVGPYRFYGEQLVKACIENGCHHLDISGELLYLEKMQLLYSGKANEAGVYIIGACGFDCVPGEMGMIFTKKKFPGDLNSLEILIRLDAGPEGYGVNVTTLESAVHSVAHRNELVPLRRSLFPKPLPQSQYQLKERPAGFNEKVGKWCLKFPGSDQAIMNRSIRYHYEVNRQRPFQVGAYIELPTFFMMVKALLFGIIFSLFAKFSFGRSLFLKFPSFFSGGIFRKDGPTKTQIETTSFTITVIGEGWSEKCGDLNFPHDKPPNMRVVTQVSGPEAGYVTTPICLVQCALVLLKEKQKLPPGGGVFTTAAAYYNTTLVERLQEHNILFKEVKRETI